MNKKQLFRQIIIRVIHFAFAILIAALVSGLIAFIVSQITEDLKTIVVSCLIGVWISEVILYIARCKILYKDRIKIIDEIDSSKLQKKKSDLIKKYIISTTILSLAFGFVLYNLENDIIHNIMGDDSNNTLEGNNDTILLVKIGIVFILVIILSIRMLVRKRGKNKIEKLPVEKKL